jgi:imidazoleglycerol-phosphate dehydratase
MRSALIERNTLETSIRVSLSLEGTGRAQIQTGIGFFDHMLEQIVRHGLIDMEIKADGDLHIDAHHTVEDVGIAFGQALSKALGNKQGINRYADVHVPLDEALTRAVIDISGRPGLFFNVNFTRPHIGSFDTDLVREFFQAVVNHAGITLHLDNVRGENAHHIAESTFKAFARALRQACALDTARLQDIPSTKGTL